MIFFPDIVLTQQNSDNQIADYKQQKNYYIHANMQNKIPQNAQIIIRYALKLK